MSKIRRSTIAGQWYPGTAQKLATQIENFFANVPPLDLAGQVIGLVSPHAGYTYSGQVAAYAYNLVRGQPIDLVAILSPIHRMHAGPLNITDVDAYQTPLGDVPLARALIETMAEQVDLTRLPQDNEHSLEIQLPFLQVALGSSFKLLPIMMGRQDWHTCTLLAGVLGELLAGKNALLVASTDLSHFHNTRQAEQLDRVTLNHIDTFDPDGLSRALQRSQTEACGGGPVVAAMLAAQALGADKAQTLKYDTSGTITGDTSNVVGYGAGVLYKSSNS